MTRQYQKIPIVVEAEQLTKRTSILTLEGQMIGNPGDWLITGIEGEQYPCKDSIFRKTYREVGIRTIDRDEEMKARADVIESPASCHYRLEEDGKYGCGYYHGYAGARNDPCPSETEFPDGCPLEVVKI